MNEFLYEVEVQHKQTGERLRLRLWAENAASATQKLVGLLLGRKCEYEWCYTNAICNADQKITREGDYM